MQWKKEKTEIIDYTRFPLNIGWFNSPYYKGEMQIQETISKKIYQTGPQGVLLKHILEDIKSTKEVLCLSSFIISEPQIIEAILKLLEDNKKNIRIYLITALDRQLDQRNEFTSKRKEDDLKFHRNLLNKLVNKALIRSFSGFHSKFILIDPQNPKDRKGFLLSANLAKETFLEKMELGYRLSNTEIIQVYNQFLKGFWLIAEHEVLESNRTAGVRILASGNKYEKTKCNIPYTIGNDSTLKSAIKDIIAFSKTKIVLSTFYIQSDYEITQSLINKCQNNVEVLIFVRRRNPNMKALSDLEKAGATILGNSLVHAKFIIGITGNENKTLVMTANFETKGLDEGFETGLMLDDHEALKLMELVEKWKQIFPYELKSSYERGDYLGRFFEWDGTSMIEREVISDDEESFKEQKNIDFEKLDIHKPNLIYKKSTKKLPQKVLYKWTNVPPILPNKTKEVQKEGYSIYTKKNKKYVVIDNIKDYEWLKRVSEEENAILVIKEEK